MNERLKEIKEQYEKGYIYHSFFGELLTMIDELEAKYQEALNHYGFNADPFDTIADLKNKLEKAQNHAKFNSQIIHNMVVLNQSAWIEWKHGDGAERAMEWVHNSLVGPGHIPTAEFEAQVFYENNLVSASPKDGVVQ